MKNLLSTIVLSLIVWQSHAQTDLESTFKQLYDAEKYDEIIAYKPGRKEEMTAKALYYRGMSHYMKSEDTEAMKFLDKAIEKGPVDHDMYYYKGMLYFYGEQFKEAIPYFDKAIAMFPDESDFYGCKGDAYYKLDNLDSAIVSFEIATSFSDCNTRVYLLMGEVYQAQDKMEKALACYKTAFGQLKPGDNSYQNCSFNLGLSYQLTGNPTEAKANFERHLETFPDDYRAMTKVVQSYYALGEYYKTIQWKTKLYEAHKLRKLPQDISVMFCFDQFYWNDKLVMAFENFAELEDEDGPMFVKHHFYVMKKDGGIDYRVDTESSSAIRTSGPNSKYVLCLVKDGSHYTSWSYIFGDDFKYPDMKNAVLNILNEKVKPDATFSPAKK